jgi:hypothetical protein
MNCGCGFTEERCLPTPVDPAVIKTTFIMFPNPVTMQTLYFSESISGTVYDAKGTLVFSFKDLESIDTGILENGLYLIYTQNGEAYKFLVAR